MKEERLDLEIENDQSRLVELSAEEIKKLGPYCQCYPCRVYRKSNIIGRLIFKIQQRLFHAYCHGCHGCIYSIAQRYVIEKTKIAYQNNNVNNF